MINLNGELVENSKLVFNLQKRKFDFANAITDILKCKNKKVYFIEDHYFRLMSSMRMIRMKIPIQFTLDYYEKQILKSIIDPKTNCVFQIRVIIFREDSELTRLQCNAINFSIEVKEYVSIVPKFYEIDLYKDFYLYSGILSTLKTTNRLIFDLASIYALENDIQNGILINEKKNIVQVVDSNIFLIKGEEILTPPLSEGCIDGIIRMKIIDLLITDKSYILKEIPISPFELLLANEVFITNSMQEIQSVSKYRKKTYQTNETVNIKRLIRKEIG